MEGGVGRGGGGPKSRRTGRPAFLGSHFNMAGKYDGEKPNQNGLR